MKITTLCYIEKEDAYLMLHRTKKENDMNKDKWIGVGGHAKEDESPEECLLREVKEETGLLLTSYQFRGLVTFVSDACESEQMCLFTSDCFTGDLGDCKEGDLAWIKKEDVPSLPTWEGDAIFLRLLLEGERRFFTLKLVYEGSRLASHTLQFYLEQKEACLDDTSSLDDTNSATGRKEPLPQLHTIAYPEKYRQGEDGASYFFGKTDHYNSRYYVFNDYYNMESDETLHILTHFETYQQTTEYTCGAACALMVLNYFGQKRYHEKVLEQLLESHPEKGSTVENIADFFDLIGWHVESHSSTNLRFDTIEYLERSIIKCIDKRIPIMVDWADWHGHWQVIIGIDTCGGGTPYDDVLIFADPYDTTDHYQDGYYIFSLGRFFNMWYEGPCAKKDEPYNQPFVIACPKHAD